MRLSLPRFAVFIVALLFSAAPAKAVIIDHFDEPESGQTVSRTSVGTTTGTAVSFTSPAFGTTSRTLSIQITAASSPAKATGSVNFTTADNYELINNPNTDSLGTITYSKVGGLNQNLSGFNTFRLMNVSQVASTTYKVELDTGSPVTGSSTASVSKLGNFAGDVDIPFASLVGTASLTDIDRIIVTIDTDGKGTGALVDAVGLFAVAEPGSLLLLGSGFVGLGALLVRRRVGSVSRSR